VQSVGCSCALGDRREIENGKRNHTRLMPCFASKLRMRISSV
jgi:hypothetical protein